eukprot:TRINITY_DN902_c1_g2_i1.p1 TRINITY_DN902_c1_g2~~TRINITY_DN902_c1_g2_i1.p1  ORF type:complete len:261 (+),score=49.10 TRINITY_DN902_c1_g2_i1:50-832(+)
MPFIELLILNMVLASGIAALGDVATQHAEIYTKERKKRKNKRGGMREGEEVVTTEELVVLDDNGEAQTVEKGTLGIVMKEGGSSFLVVGTDCYQVTDDEIIEATQKYEPARTGRMMAVAGLVFDPLSFTWYYVLLPLIVPGHVGHLTAHQMTRKILWDTIVYGGVVSSVSITANAALQEPTAKHIKHRFISDFPILYGAACVLSIPADIPVFLLVPAKWQAVSFKVMDAVFMLVVSFVINRKIPEFDKKKLVERKRKTAA